MNNIANEYNILLSDFLDKKISSISFQKKYMNKFKNEQRNISMNLYNILEDIFSNCDLFTKDKNLIIENENYYIDEDLFIKNISNLYILLNKYSSNNN